MKRLRAARIAARSERGAALVMALLVLVVLTAFGLTLIGLGLTEVAISTNWRDYTKDFYAAEAALENGVVGLRSLLDSTPQPTQAQLDAITGALTVPTLTDPGLTFGVYSITPLAPAYKSTFASGPYVGLLGNVAAYQIRAQVNGQSGTRADLTQVFQYTQIPLFQFGVLYGRGVDLEIAPGPDMTFNGRVHANSNIYVGAGSTLSFDSYITTAGSIYRRLKRESAIPWGNTPQIKDKLGVYQNLNFDSQYRPGFGSTWASASEWVAQAASTFKGTVKDGSMEVAQLVPPVPDLLYSTHYDPSNPSDPNNPDNIAHQLIEMPKGTDSTELASAKLYSQANVRIIDGVPTGLTCVTVPSGAITTKTFVDAREGKTANITQLDVNLLRTNNCLNYTNGAVLFVASTSAVTSTTLPAVRLVNGSQLPSHGLTVVSQNPVYVQGDYNTVTPAGWTPPPGVTTPGPPAAIMADAITVLSNNWGPNNSDTKGSQVKTNRKAVCNSPCSVPTATTVNAAFALGPSVESTMGAGNGQLENVIRFLEDWTGSTFNYSGSIISLWHSRQATGVWTSAYYTPPARNWSYDLLFNTSPPPGTPQGVLLSRGRWAQS